MNKGTLLVHGLVAVAFCLFATSQVYSQQVAQLPGGTSSAAQSANSPENDPQFGSLTGKVVDKKSDAPLAGVNVLLAGTRRGTTTDKQGLFVLENIPAGKYRLRITYIGYAAFQQNEVQVIAGQVISLSTIVLEEEAIPISEVVVSPGSYTMLGEAAAIRQTLGSDDIAMMGWAEDMTRAIRRVPGISADDYSAAFSIRGGDVDEVLTLLDGMQIYQPYHQKDFGGGLFSTIDIEAIDGLDLYTGGFAAGYGDRMSGVLDMKTKAPKSGERTTSVGVSLMNARLFSMGPFAGQKGSWLLSARRGYLDLLNRLMNNAFKLKPNYYDILGKLDYRLGDRHTISLHAFLANDSYKLNDVEFVKGKAVPNVDHVDTRYGNNYGWLTLNSAISGNAVAHTILYGGSLTRKRFWDRYDDDPNEHLNTALISDDRNFDLLGAKQDWNFEISDNFLLKAGVDYKHQKVRYDYFNDIQNEFISAEDSLVEQNIAFSAQKNLTGNQLALYLSNRLRLTPALTVEGGLRYDNTSYTGDKLWSPRLNLAYAIGKSSFLRAGWGKFYQSQEIDNLDIQFGETIYQPAELAEHFVLGMEHLFQSGWHLRAEGYLKNMSRLRSAWHTFADIDEFFPEARDDLIRVSADKGTTKGMELYLKYDTGRKFSTWLSYTLSEATNTVTDIQYEGRLEIQTGEQPRPMDQRHTINLDANYRLNRAWHVNMAWQYRSGWPGTEFTVQRIERPDGSYAFYHDNGLFNGINNPAYHRMDARINKYFYTSRGKITTFLHVINLYNHENVIRYDHDIIESTAENFRYSVSTETWFGITPFIGLSWEF